MNGPAGSQALQVTGARKKYGVTEALRGVDLTLHRGEWLALLGPNGAGKTTLIRAIAGRVRLDAGAITLLGEPLDAAGGSGARAKLGVVPQDLALYPKLTARENLEVFGSLLGLAGTTLRERVRWGLDFTALAERAAERVEGFSGGMKRRLNIAAGVLHRPEVVLLDEPTVGVDPQSRQRIYEMLEGLRESGASLLMTTHQLDEVESLSGRIVIVDHGLVIADGSVPELIAKTLGGGRVVTARLHGPLQAAAAAALGGEAGAGTLSTRLQDLGAELPVWLSRVASGGGRIAELTVEAPSLHAVFLHLTGRELRE